jgi:murein DD-endopeptidase MepM/ murein hydrolase activator NlpD
VKTFFVAGALLLLVGVPAWLFFYVSDRSEIHADPRILGVKNQIAVRVDNPNGVRLVRAILLQGSYSSSTAIEATSKRLIFLRRNLPAASFQLPLAVDATKGFRSGPARLTVETLSNDPRGKLDSRSWSVALVLEPPRVQADSLQHYVNQGGAELVVFTVSGGWTEAGVKIGSYRFRSFAMPGSKNPAERFSLFVYPYDVPAGERPLVYARDAAGNEVTSSFWFKLFPKTWRKREIELTEAFLEKVTGELAPGDAAGRLDRFLHVNGAMRRENNATLAALRSKTQEQMLWTPPFEQLSNSKVEALFADYRTYVHQGKKVDQQVHLGFDLSKVAQAPVVAANSGRVAYAGPLGIYGNCIVIDHGFALQSIYAHLSSIAVKEGDSVQRRQEIGRSGATGLAGGDHLHYSMQIDGVQTNPLEWWDAHWIQDRVLSKIPAK